MKRLLIIISCIILTFSLLKAQQQPINSHYPSESPIFRNENINAKKPVEIFPNPVDDFLTVTIDKNEFKNVEFEVYNIIGNAHKISVEDLARGTYKINLSNFNAGYYLLVVKDTESRTNKAFKFQVK
ncbi:MAG: T9SS type A sorting domain-containing protein [Cyclobacteriaceae bacterium]